MQTFPSGLRPRASGTRGLRPVILCLLAVLAAACSNTSRGVTADASADASEVGLDTAADTADALDADVSDAPDTTVRRCPDDRFCAPGERCLGGVCVGDPCSTDANTCGNNSCLAQCVTLRDPCEGVRCEAQQTCVDGRCIAGCFPVPCVGQMETLPHA